LDVILVSTLPAPLTLVWRPSWQCDRSWPKSSSGRLQVKFRSVAATKEMKSYCNKASPNHLPLLRTDASRSREKTVKPRGSGSVARREKLGGGVLGPAGTSEWLYRRHPAILAFDSSFLRMGLSSLGHRSSPPVKARTAWLTEVFLRSRGIVDET
jgi:hypothetical protein